MVSVLFLSLLGLLRCLIIFVVSFIFSLHSYMQLSTHLSKQRPVYALDDKVVESGIDFPFKTIEEVATSCITVINSILSDRIQADKGVEVDLAGWSYGGVVAVEVAKQLVSSNVNIKVRSVVMFDSPLRSAVVQDSVAHKEEDIPFDYNKQGSSKSAATTLERATKHFKACTSLLSLYHQRPKEQMPLACAVLDIRPQQSEYLLDQSALEELTSGPIVKETVPGTHWTILYDNNAVATAEVVEQFWR